jgi:hypothetical protein
METVIAIVLLARLFSRAFEITFMNHEKLLGVFLPRHEHFS